MFRRSLFFSYKNSSSSSSSLLFKPSSILLQYNRGAGGAGTGSSSSNKPEDAHFMPYDEMNKATGSRLQSIMSHIIMQRAATPKELHHLNPVLADWVACEKIHGSNFGMYLVDGCSKFRVAKRSAFLPMSEHFFGVHVMLPQMERWTRNILNLVESGQYHKPGHFPGLKNRNNNNNNNNNNPEEQQQQEQQQESLIDTIVVNGEVFGAKYFHQALGQPKVLRKFYLETGKKAEIQTPQADRFPQYSNDLMFAGFEIRYRLKNDSSKKIFTVPFDAANQIFERVLQEEREKENEKRFFYCKPLFRGKLEDIIMHDIQHLPTTVPLQMGFGEYYFKANWSEGVVLRNVMHGHPELNTEASSSILKYKNSYFNELRHGSQKSKDGGTPVFKDDLAPVKKDFFAKMSEKKIPLPEAIFPSDQDVEACKKMCSMVTAEMTETQSNTKNNKNKNQEEEQKQVESSGKSDDTTNKENQKQQEEKEKEEQEEELLLDEDDKILKELPERLRVIISKNGGVDAARIGDLTKNRAEYLLAQSTLTDFLQSTNDENVVAMDLTKRREFSRYLWYECKKVVASEWRKHQFFGEVEGGVMEA